MTSDAQSRGVGGIPARRRGTAAGSIGNRRPARLAATASVALAACGGPPRPEPVPKPHAPRITRVAAEEPEPDDGVQVVAAKGHMDPGAVEAGVAPHRTALTGCYTERVGKRRWLGGHVVLRWEVAADGTILRVLLADSDLGAWPVEQCLLAIARVLAFGKPIGGGAAELTLPLEFSLCQSASASPSGSHPVPASRSGARDPSGDPPGGCSAKSPPVWDVEHSAQAVGGQLVKLAACARGKVAAPGEVAITLYAGPRGRVESVGFASATTALDEEWAACAEKTALAWHLPDPKGQVTKLAVRYRPR